MNRILLVNPSYELEIRWIVNEEEIDVKADYLPLGLCTLAALTPEEFHVDIWDELVRGPLNTESIFDGQYDLIGITSCRANLPRAQELAKIFRMRGIPVAVGGPGVSGTPDRCRNHFDILFIGEAELTWPQFLRDWQSGNYRSEYRQIEKPDIALSPLPKWDCVISDLKKYAQGCVQTTRGCPFDCEFCDVVYLNGRKQRHKTIEQVLKEVRVLERLGMSTIFFSDDNFVGNRRYAKDLLRALIPMNNAFPKLLRYATQASIDMSRDDELLELLADANFYQFVIGLESPNQESLKETGKYQNLKGDMVAEVHKILSYGMVVRGALVLGFDHDDLNIFDLQYDFIQKSFLPSVSLHMLNAPIGTRLWRRLRAESRVIDPFKITDKATQRIFNNIIPKRMSRVELMQGFRDLYKRVFSWESFKERMFGFVSLLRHTPKVLQEPESLPKLLKLGETLNLGPEARKAMEDIFRYTEQKTPVFLGRVKELVIQFIRYAESAHSLIPKMEELIELEFSGRVVFGLDNRPIPVTPAFRENYRSIFPDIYRRVYLNLEDKSKVPEVLVEVFVDFLSHEEGCEHLDESHRAILNDIVDNTCVRFNGEKPNEFKLVVATNGNVSDVKNTQLHEDILKSVEQELIRFIQSKGEIKEPRPTNFVV